MVTMLLGVSLDDSSQLSKTFGFQRGQNACKKVLQFTLRTAARSSARWGFVAETDLGMLLL